eukprot:CAMPEP_0181325948 /NCGR_PEP_ID=MMETSP1101-20121128/21217_1 /TAXON_ID=46948 /ORGANISM="Rhodomonas abbreviata, Strain Caron Lab Isolate" /LENGTH=241 /DNA_ID=CAMNT_0023434329 /DNA_START=44 /DNA_END=766 /DNA_ORIENTATION=+
MSTASETSKNTDTSDTSSSDDVVVYPRVKGGEAVVVSVQFLERYFHRPLPDVAKELGVCCTTMKKVCRKLGIDRWPNKSRPNRDQKRSKNTEPSSSHVLPEQVSEKGSVDVHVSCNEERNPQAATTGTCSEDRKPLASVPLSSSQAASSAPSSNHPISATSFSWNHNQASALETGTKTIVPAWQRPLQQHTDLSAANGTKTSEPAWQRPLLQHTDGVNALSRPDMGPQHSPQASQNLSISD